MEDPLNDDSVLLKISLRKNVKLKDTKKFILKMIKAEFEKKGIEVDREIEFTFQPNCGCPELKMFLNEIPLEDLKCYCGKTTIIKYIKF